MDRRTFLRCSACQLVLAACGSSRSTAGPGSTFTSTTVAGTPASTSPSSLLPSTTSTTLATTDLRFDAGVSDEDRRLVTTGIEYARAYCDANGAPLARSFALTVSQGDPSGKLPASTGVGPSGAPQVEIVAAHTGWSRQLPVLRQRIAAHEYFHVIQINAHRGGLAPWWFFEGSAEYVGYSALISQGVLDVATARELAGMRRGIGDLLRAPRLDELETRSQWMAGTAAPMAQVYPLGYAAVDALLGSSFTVRDVVSFFQQINNTDWRSAFERTFGKTAATFYEEIAHLRAR